MARWVGDEPDPLLLNPDVAQINSPGTGLEVLQYLAITDDGLAEMSDRNRQVIVDDVHRLDQEFATGLFIERAGRLKVDLVKFRIAVLDKIEAAIVLVAGEHGVLDESGIPVKAEQRGLEIVVGGQGINERRELHGTRREIDSYCFPGVLHVGDEL